MGIYGDEELKILGDLYGKGDSADVDVPVLKAEWEASGFKPTIRTLSKKF